MKSRIAVLLGGGALALGLGACGGGGSTGSGEASAAATTKPEAAKQAPSSASGGLTPPGSKLKFGQAATVAWVPGRSLSRRARPAQAALSVAEICGAARRVWSTTQ